MGFEEKKSVFTWAEFFDCFGLLRRSPEFRIHAPHSRWKGSVVEDFHGILSEDLIGNYDFHGLRGTLVIENPESLIPLVERNKDYLLIWGGGWRCVQLAALISRLPVRKFYWGDIDKEGIEIAAQFCKETGASPIYMDIETIEANERISQQVNYETPIKKIDLLQASYLLVCERNLRIEQEKIIFDWKVLKIKGPTA